jgi:hypothetical protein
VKNIFVPLTFLITVIAVPVTAQENFRLNLNSGDLGIAGNIPLNDELSREITISLLNIGIENRRTNIGMEFTPFRYFDWSKPSEENSGTTAYSLANFNFYWNILYLEFFDANIYFGPFTSINYLFVEDKINWSRFIFTAGVHMGFRASVGPNYKVVSIELGYRNIDGRSKYHIGAKVDLAVSILSFLLFINLASSSETNDSNIK